jgi:cytochrome P450
MAAVGSDLGKVYVGERDLWQDGPPHELFERLRRECPVHWTERITEYPEEAGYWSVTTADDVHTVSRDWKAYSSELGGITAVSRVFPIELTRAMFIGMDPPKHDRLKALFQAGFTPKRIAEHEPAIRQIVHKTLDRVQGKEDCELVNEVAQLIAERRERPTDDLTSVLVHAEVEGSKLEEPEIVMGFFLLVAAGNDSTKATYCSGMRALMEDPEQKQLLLDDPSLVPDAVEESLRMFPAFAHFRRTASEDTELHGQKIKKGEKVVMWYVSSNRDESRYEEPDRFDLRRKAEHQAFGAGGRHFCLGTALARLELRVLFEETLARFPGIALAGEPRYVESPFVNQLKTLPVRLGA